MTSERAYRSCSAVLADMVDERYDTRVCVMDVETRFEKRGMGGRQ